MILSHRLLSSNSLDVFGRGDDSATLIGRNRVLKGLRAQGMGEVRVALPLPPAVLFSMVWRDDPRKILKVEQLNIKIFKTLRLADRSSRLPRRCAPRNDKRVCVIGAGVVRGWPRFCTVPILRIPSWRGQTGHFSDVYIWFGVWEMPGRGGISGVDRIFEFPPERG